MPRLLKDEISIALNSKGFVVKECRRPKTTNKKKEKKRNNASASIALVE